MHMRNVALYQIRENGGTHRSGAEEGNGLFLCSLLSFVAANVRRSLLDRLITPQLTFELLTRAISMQLIDGLTGPDCGPYYAR